MNGCIEWQKYRNKLGYGQLKHKGRKVEAHRFTWEKAYGPIERGLVVCHKCDNPSCINLEHLFLGTQGDNIKDCYNKKRRTPPSKPKIQEQTAVRIKMLAGVLSARRIAILLGTAPSYIKNVMSGKRFPDVTSNTRYF